MKKEKMKSIELGKMLWKEISQLPRDIKTKENIETVTFKSPSRVNMEILDFTKMKPNTPESHSNSGSIGFGISLYSEIEVKLIPNSMVFNIERPEHEKLLKHVAMMMKDLTNYDGGFEITAKGNPYNHVGLGSTASLTNACWNAINIALGKPFTDRELVKLAAFNYAEVGKDGNLYGGQSTGMSGWVSKKGGFCITSTDAELIFREEIPEEYKVIVGLPDIPEGQGLSVADSDIEMADLGKFSVYDRFNSAKVCHWTLMRLMPALIDKDYEKVGDIAWDMFSNNCKGIVGIVLHKEYRPLKVLIDLKRAGATLAFVSSVGPGMITLVLPEKIKEIKEAFVKHRLKTMEFDVDNKGGQII